eukprot:CAMPEP_0113904816 /NCGR_PEP_ID=MMETSP0780_2-20120614/23545_1 /TAXON_ID=652834 /ORGANISM="Palpitomonas bilix" /LENGTH=493 /DNA_ID=CAMNT_0000898633 /DNA_START=111 /DNA_END=1588 /DNA_ORIENTATION=- /assembly_acc=CAM_ASM_000599
MPSPLSTIASLLDTAKGIHKGVFGRDGEGAGVAPGRVEVLGNHTDYNDGFVLSAAIDRYTVQVGSMNSEEEGDVFHFHSANFGESKTVSFKLDEKRMEGEERWANYVKGPLLKLKERGMKVRGFSSVIYGDLPVGAGMSSSAAIGVSTVMLYSALFYPASSPSLTSLLSSLPHPAATSTTVTTSASSTSESAFPLSKIEVARLVQKSENEFVGVNCGLLDQVSSTFGEDNCLLYLDCRTLRGGSSGGGQKEVEEGNKEEEGAGEIGVCTIPLPPSCQLLLVHSLSDHELADGTYNRLTEDCAAAAAALGVSHLRDATAADLPRLFADSHLSDRQKMRGRHVVSENERVRQAVSALRHAAPPPSSSPNLAEQKSAVEGDEQNEEGKEAGVIKLGELMYASHNSSRDDFGNSVVELDEMVAYAYAKTTGSSSGDDGGKQMESGRGRGGVFGCRLCGGGYGGCVICLVEAEEVDRIEEGLKKKVEERTGKSPPSYR